MLDCRSSSIIRMAKGYLCAVHTLSRCLLLSYKTHCISAKRISKDFKSFPISPRVVGFGAFNILSAYTYLPKHDRNCVQLSVNGCFIFGCNLELRFKSGF